MAKRILIISLQAIVVILGIAALIILIRFPLTEGRAENLNLFSIYFDAFILYIYASSAVFFAALFKVFKLLGLIRQDNTFTLSSVRALRTIKHCAVILSFLIVLAGLYIKFFHHKDDDPAGFLAICIATAFVSVMVAVVAAQSEKFLKKKMDENH